MKNQLKELGRGIQIVYTDSKVYNMTKSNWLQGGIMNIIAKKAKGLYNKQEIVINDLGR